MPEKPFEDISLLLVTALLAVSGFISVFFALLVIFTTGIESIFIKTLVIFTFFIVLVVPVAYFFICRQLFSYLKERQKILLQLHEHEKQYRELFEEAPSGYMEYNEEGRITAVNKKQLEMFGYSAKEDLVGKFVWEFVQEREESRRTILGKMSGTIPESRGLERSYIRKDGTLVSVLIDDFFITDGNGRIRGNRGVSTDISAQKKIEEVLRESEEKYRMMFEHAGIGIILINASTGRRVAFNREQHEMLGYTREEYEKTYPSNFLFENMAGSYLETLSKLVEKKTSLVETRLKKKDGSTLEILSSAVLIKIDGEDYIHFLNVDITQQKKIEKELLESQKKLHAIFNSVQTGIIIIEAETHKVLSINPYAASCVGAPESEITGKNCQEVLCSQKDGKCPITDLGREIDRTECSLVTSEGSKIPIIKTVLPVDLEDKRYLLESFVDISEQKRSEMEKRELEVKLAYAQKMESIGVLAGGIAHNFNNLFMAIQGNTSLLSLYTADDQKLKEPLDRIDALIKKGSELTRQLLGYAMKGKYHVKTLDFNKTLHEALEIFSITRDDIKTHSKFDESLFPVNADQDQIVQMLNNLLLNAADAMPEGGDIFIKTANVTHNEISENGHEIKPGDYVLFSIRDTGKGIDKEILKNIFDPFFTTKGLACGTGLGLAAVYGIVRGHGGYINVSINSGTEFRLYFPRSKEEESAD